MALSFKTTMAPLTAQNMWKRNWRQKQCADNNRGISDVLTITSVHPSLLKGTTCSAKPDDIEPKLTKCSPKSVEHDKHVAPRPELAKNEQESRNQAKHVSSDQGTNKCLPRGCVKRSNCSDSKSLLQNIHVTIKTSKQNETKTIGQKYATAAGPITLTKLTALSPASSGHSGIVNKGQGSRHAAKPSGLRCAGIKVMALRRLTLRSHGKEKAKENTQDTRSSADSVDSGVADLEAIDSNCSADSQIVDRRPSQLPARDKQTRISIRDCIPLLVRNHRNTRSKGTYYTMTKESVNPLLQGQDRNSKENNQSETVSLRSEISDGLLLNSMDNNKKWINPIESRSLQKPREDMCSGKLVPLHNGGMCISNVTHRTEDPQTDKNCGDTAENHVDCLPVNVKSKDKENRAPITLLNENKEQFKNTTYGPETNVDKTKIYGSFSADDVSIIKNASQDSENNSIKTVTFQNAPKNYFQNGNSYRQTTQKQNIVDREKVTTEIPEKGVENNERSENVVEKRHTAGNCIRHCSATSSTSTSVAGQKETHTNNTENRDSVATISTESSITSVSSTKNKYKYGSRENVDTKNRNGNDKDTIHTQMKDVHNNHPSETAFEKIGVTEADAHISGNVLKSKDTSPNAPGTKKYEEEKHTNTDTSSIDTTQIKSPQTNATLSEPISNGISNRNVFSAAEFDGVSLISTNHLDKQCLPTTTADSTTALQKSLLGNRSSINPTDTMSHPAQLKTEKKSRLNEREEKVVPTGSGVTKDSNKKPEINATGSENKQQKAVVTVEMPTSGKDSSSVPGSVLSTPKLQSCSNGNADVKHSDCWENVERNHADNAQSLSSLDEVHIIPVHINIDKIPEDCAGNIKTNSHAECCVSEEQDTDKKDGKQSDDVNNETLEAEADFLELGQDAASPKEERSTTETNESIDHTKSGPNTPGNIPYESMNASQQLGNSSVDEIAVSADTHGREGEIHTPHINHTHPVETENTFEEPAASGAMNASTSTSDECSQTASFKPTNRKAVAITDDTRRSQSKKNPESPHYGMPSATVTVYSQKLPRSSASSKTPKVSKYREDVSQTIPPSWARVRSAQPQVFRNMARAASRARQRRSKSVMDMAGSKGPASKCHCQRRLPGTDDGSCQCDTGLPDTKTELDGQVKLFTMLWEQCLSSKSIDKAQDFLAQISFPQRQQLVFNIGKKGSMLAACCRLGKVQMVNYLLDECGADIDQKEAYEDSSNPATSPTIHRDVTPLWCAAVEGHVDVVKGLIHRGADIHAKTANGSSAIRSACYNLHVDVVETLLKAGADVHSPNINGVTCLMNGCNSPEMCQLLLRHGACANDKDSSGNTALHYAASLGQLQSLRLLLQYGGNVWEKNGVGNSVLRCAALKGWMHIIDFLAHCTSANISEVIEAYELAGCKLVDLGGREESFFGAGISAWQRAMHLRHISKTPKTHMRQDKIAPFQFQLEFTTLREVDYLTSDPDEAQVQSLLIRERICGPKHEELVRAMVSLGAAKLEADCYRQCIDLWTYAFRLSLDSPQPGLRDMRSIPQKILKLFSELCEQRTKDVDGQEVLLVSDTLEMLQLLVQSLTKSDAGDRTPHAKHEIHDGRDCGRTQGQADNHLNTDQNGLFLLHVDICLYLVRVIATYQNLSPADLHRFRSLVYRLVKSDYCSHTGESLLHMCFPLGDLSRIYAETETDKSEQHRVPTIQLLETLLLCGADADAVNKFGESPLFYILNPGPGRGSPIISSHPDKDGWIELLLKHGAHADRVSCGRQGLLKALQQQHTFCPLSHVKLQCIAARTIKDHRLFYSDPCMLPSHLISFVDYH